MFTRNVGKTDRTLRIVLGVAMLAGFFFLNLGAWNWVLLLGAVFLATGLMNFCPIYRVLGINTCRVKTG